MFTVDGYIDGVAYRAVVGAAPQPGEDPGLRAGCVTGDPGVIGLLMASAGAPWLATPTGPSGLLDASDPASVFGFLADRTDITGTSGDVPDITGPYDPAAIY